MNVVKGILRRVIDRAAGSYVSGPELSDAIACARALARDGVSSTVAYWNDNGEDPPHVHAAYLAAIDAVGDAGTPTYVSIKAPALSMSVSLTEELAARCRERGIGLHFDSLAIEHQAATWNLIEQLAPAGIALGCTLPGRFARSVNDAARAARGLRVRVVKGQWDDPGGAIDPRTGFMAVVDRLAGRAAHVAVATHDPVLVEEALTTLAGRGTPAEVELLFGLPMRGASDVARRLNVPVRIYVPYGHPWLPYSLSAMRRNPHMLRWLVRDALRGRTLRVDRRA